MTTHNTKDTDLVVCLSGELDHNRVETLREELDAMIRDSQADRLVLDMRHVTFMDSSGIGMLIGRYRLLNRRGGRLAVRSLTRPMDELCRLAGLYDIIEKE